MTDLDKKDNTDFMASIDEAVKGVEPGVIGGIQRDEDGRVAAGVSVGVGNETLTFGGRVRYYGKRAWDAFAGVTWRPKNSGR